MLLGDLDFMADLPGAAVPLLEVGPVPSGVIRPSPRPSLDVVVPPPITSNVIIDVPCPVSVAPLYTG